MRAIHFDGILRYRDDLIRPAPPPGEALVRTRLAGICNTDREIVRGYLGFKGVLGHEFVGTVLQANGAPELVGRRVVGEINAYCGDCPTCRRGDPTHCPHRTTLGISRRDGVMADCFTLPTHLLYPLPDTLPDEWAVFAEPLAAALEITDRLPVRPTQRAIVLGDGKLGLLIAQVLQLTGCDLLVVGRHAQKTGRSGPARHPHAGDRRQHRAGRRHRGGGHRQRRGVRHGAPPRAAAGDTGPQKHFPRRRESGP